MRHKQKDNLNTKETLRAFEVATQAGKEQGMSLSEIFKMFDNSNVSWFKELEGHGWDLELFKEYLGKVYLTYKNEDFHSFSDMTTIQFLSSVE